MKYEVICDVEHADITLTVRAEVELPSGEVCYRRVSTASGDMALDLDEITERRPQLRRALNDAVRAAARELWEDVA